MRTSETLTTCLSKSPSFELIQTKEVAAMTSRLCLICTTRQLLVHLRLSSLRSGNITAANNFRDRLVMKTIT